MMKPGSTSRPSSVPLIFQLIISPVLQPIPLQDVLNVLSDISEAQGATTNFVGIGLEVARIGYETSKAAIGYARVLRPKNTQFSVYYDEVLPNREKGGENTVIHIRITPA